MNLKRFYHFSLNDGAMGMDFFVESSFLVIEQCKWCFRRLICFLSPTDQGSPALKIPKRIHSRTWTLKMMVSNRNLLFAGVYFQVPC